MPNSPAPQRPDVRGRILRAALALLAEQGPGGLTQPKVARAAGVRQGHLTYYFPTRADLLLAVVTQSMAGMMSALAQGAQDGTLTLDSLPAALAAGAADKRRARVMLGLIATADEDPKVREHLRQFIRALRINLAGLLRQLGVEADADTLAACHALLVGAAILNVARDDAASQREAQMLARFLVERILGPLRDAAGVEKTARAAPRGSSAKRGKR